MLSAIFRVVVGFLAISGTAVALGPGPIALGSAGNFSILAEAGISNIPISAITGDMGVSPAAASSITGFSLVLASGGTYSTSTQVVGKVYAANYANPTPSYLTTAIADMLTACGNCGRCSPPNFSPTSGNLGGLTLTGGIYKYTGAVTIPTSFTISGSATDTWVFQVAGTLTQSAGTKITLTGGALAQNIFWCVPGDVVIGPGATFRGILCATSVTLETGATVIGRIFAQGTVALQKATVTA